MSIKQMVKVWEHEFPHPQQSIMLALADHAHDDGTNVRPSIDYVAWKTGYSRRSVQNIIYELKSMGVLVLVHPSDRRNPNTYRFNWKKATKKKPFERKIRGAISAPHTKNRGAAGVQTEESRGAIPVHLGENRGAAGVHVGCSGGADDELRGATGVQLDARELHPNLLIEPSTNKEPTKENQYMSVDGEVEPDTSVASEPPCAYVVNLEEEIAKAEESQGMSIKASKKRSKRSEPERRNSREEVKKFFKGVRTGSDSDKALGLIERLTEFSGFWGWYQEKVCKPCDAAHGNLAEAAEAWLELEGSNFLGQGYEEFRRGCLEFVKTHKGARQVGVKHACRFLVGDTKTQAPWLSVLEGLGSAEGDEEFLGGVDDSYDLDAVLGQIGVELRRTGRDCRLPEELGRQFKKGVVSQLDAQQACIFLKWLRNQPGKEDLAYAS